MAAALLVLLIAAVIAVAAPGGGPAQSGAGASTASTPSSSLPRAPHSAPSVSATISLVRGASAIPLPRSFFGFSIEVWDAMHDARYLALFKRAVDLVHVPGDGPQVLRIGGNSTDQSYWHSRLPTGSPRSFELGPKWLRSVRAIVRALHTKVILGLNAVARRPGMAASEARAVLHALPPHSIVGFEIGNEPDLYWYRFRIQFASDSRSIVALAAQDRIFSPAGYMHTFSQYAAALRRVAPTVPLVGPAVSNPLRGLRWLSALVRGDRGSLGILSAHRYPLSACVHNPSSPLYPSISRLLSPQASAGMADSVRKAVALAHRNGVKFRLTEFNSVTCLGRLGVSNTFATSLWAPDAMFQMLRAGVDGMNLHLRTDSPNAPFVLSPNGFDARPAFYGLVAFTRTLGPGARLMPVNLHTRAQRLSAWAVQLDHHRLNLLVLDKSDAAARVKLNLRGARGTASVQRLLAPSVGAEQDVTFAGQSLNSAGHWVGRRVIGRLSGRDGSYSLSVPAYSAALVRVKLR
ncbi:MAG TPA: glycosyl hydrolase family 79 C-terminal domain-containing protein [Solirubrobacteraceae bacterium]|nr:glycosyl hydrolase family 79 C-terminal domain-containing protein [Solirubrobacteraceae bacterium]